MLPETNVGQSWGATKISNYTRMGRGGLRSGNIQRADMERAGSCCKRAVRFQQLSHLLSHWSISHTDSSCAEARPQECGCHTPLVSRAASTAGKRRTRESPCPAQAHACLEHCSPGGEDPEGGTKQRCHIPVYSWSNALHSCS